MNKPRKLKLTWHYNESKTEAEKVEQEKAVSRFYFNLFDNVLLKIRMRKTLEKIGLNSDNCIIIGSGILQALNIRQSHDIDVVASEEIYERLKKSGKFDVGQNHGREILKDDTFEIGTNWFVLGKSYQFNDFNEDSAIIDGVRYITLDFLLRVKKSWVKEGSVRSKDLEDIKLMEEYIERNYPHQIITWKGAKFDAAWVKGDDLSKFSPITQVYGVCFNNKNEILISRKVGDKNWIIPGGHPEGNETIEETLMREMMEEADVKVKNVKLVGAQKVYPEGKPEEYYYQVRCICELAELLLQTPDPAENLNWERKFVPVNKVTEYVKWGITGDAMFKDAIELFGK